MLANLTPKKKKIIYLAAAALVVIIIVAGLVYRSRRAADDLSQYQTELVAYADLEQTVTATGALKSASNLDLSFPFPGTARTVLAKVGAQVREGDELVALDTRDLELEVDSARSALSLAQANLNLRIAGVSSSARGVAQAEVERAEVALANARAELLATERSSAEDVQSARENLASAQTNLDNAGQESDEAVDNAYSSAIIEMEGNVVQSQKALSDMDEILGVDDADVNDGFEALLKAKSGQTFTSAQIAYSNASVSYASAQSLMLPLGDSSSFGQIDAAVSKVQEALSDTYLALSLTRDVLDSAVVGEGLTAAQLSAFKTTVDTDRTLVNTEIAGLEAARQAISTALLSSSTSQDTYEIALNAAEQALAVAQAASARALASVESQEGAAEQALELAKASLADLVAAPRDVDVAALRAEVGRALASFELAKKNLLDAVLVAPTDGVVTGVFLERGERVPAAAIAVTMLSEGNFRIEVDISESDIAKISVGDSAEVTLDAHGDDILFGGTVSSVDPGPTIIQDVIYYQVELDIAAGDHEVKQDMTANVTIFTEFKEEVLVIPTRAVRSSSGTKKVRLLRDGKVEDREVRTGLRGDDGQIEILEGLDEGEEVVTFDHSEKTAKF